MKKIISLIKSNWLTIILVIAVSFLTWRLYFFTDTFNFVLEENRKQSEDFHKQLKQIEKVNEQLKMDQEKLEKQYKEDIQIILKNYDDQLEELWKQKKLNQTKIVKNTKENPKTLTNKVEEIFGIPSEEK